MGNLTGLWLGSGNMGVLSIYLGKKRESGIK